MQETSKHKRDPLQHSDVSERTNWCFNSILFIQLLNVYDPTNGSKIRLKKLVYMFVGHNNYFLLLFKRL